MTTASWAASTPGRGRRDHRRGGQRIGGYYETQAQAQAGLPGTEITAPTPTPCRGADHIRKGHQGRPTGLLPCFTVVGLDLVVVLPDPPQVPGFQDPLLACDPDGSGRDLRLTVQDPPCSGPRTPRAFAGELPHHPGRRTGRGQPHRPGRRVRQHGQTSRARLESLDTGCRASPLRTGGGFPTAGTGDDLFLCDDELGAAPFDGLSTFDPTANQGLIDLRGPAAGLLRKRGGTGRGRPHSGPRGIPERAVPSRRSS